MAMRNDSSKVETKPWSALLFMRSRLLRQRRIVSLASWASGRRLAAVCCTWSGTDSKLLTPRNTEWALFDEWGSFDSTVAQWLFINVILLQFQKTFLEPVHVNGSRPKRVLILCDWFHFNREILLKKNIYIYPQKKKKKKMMMMMMMKQRRKKEKEEERMIRVLSFVAPSHSLSTPRGCLMSPPCLESQGCHWIPLCYLLSCSSA